MPESATNPATTNATDSVKVRLIGLNIEAFKRIRAVRLKPDGAVVKITGRNGQGKSSVLDAIEALLGGGRHAPDRPVRRGAKKATIEATTNTGLSIRRTFTDGGSMSLDVMGTDGQPIKRAQEFLDRIIGSGLALDPMQFVRMEPRQQVEVVKRVAGLDAPLAEIEARRQKAQADKTAAARDVKTLELQLSGLPDIAGPDTVMSVATLSDTLTGAVDTKAKNDRSRKGLADRKKAVADIAGEIAAKERELAALRDKGAAMQAEIDQWGPTIDALVDPDIDAIRAKIATAEADNDKARRRQARRDVLARLDTAGCGTRSGPGAEDITIEREDAIKAADLPIPGMAFTDDGLTLNGQPFEQASTAEQIRASIALAMRQNPGLAVIACREGSLLDVNSMRLLAEIAEANDLQVWTEIVTNGGGDGIVIEDGEAVQGGVQ